MTDKNAYDRFDVVRREAVMIAESLKLAAYRVRDPETGEYGPLQFHMTFDNCVMAVMGTEAAKLFATFVTATLGANNERPHAATDQEGAGIPPGGNAT